MPSRAMDLESLWWDAWPPVASPSALSFQRSHASGGIVRKAVQMSYWTHAEVRARNALPQVPAPVGQSPPNPSSCRQAR
eukprot:1656845-Amphidinium_carterae.1